MVPLHDENPTRTTPYVVFGFIILNVLIFLHEISLSSKGLNVFLDTWAVVPAQLTAGFQGELASSTPEWFTLVSSQFLHGGWGHLGGNMLYLWIFGNNIEDRLGPVKFVIFYIGCGILAGLSQWFVDPVSTIPNVGASGAIAGVMGAYIIRFPRAQIVTLIPLFIFFTTVRIPALFFLGFWFFMQAVQSVASLGVPMNMDSGGIAYWAHAGGFVFGMILGPMLGLFSNNSPRRR
ncbi:MAG: rhomboid family intramembrane serine protease [Leptolyngbyaceae cyanobacterium MO_188.B28]|nr:rhomboid family intramembrane serine protease [Leptolyngbyaceae cyanobacterium MO_188.B28]